jgi:hypothetical protein
LSRISHQRAGADAADLLVMGEGEVERAVSAASARRGAMATAAAMKPFMSQVPRP